MNKYSLDLYTHDGSAFVLYENEDHAYMVFGDDQDLENFRNYLNAAGEALEWLSAICTVDERNNKNIGPKYLDFVRILKEAGLRDV